MRSNGFKLIDNERDGRLVRQTYARSLGQAGCLILVSTTIYAQVERVQSDLSSMTDDRMMDLEEMVTKCPIVNICESLSYVPGVKIGDKGLEVIDGYGELPEIPDPVS